MLRRRAIPALCLAHCEAYRILGLHGFHSLYAVHYGSWRASEQKSGQEEDGDESCGAEEGGRCESFKLGFVIPFSPLTQTNR